ncbi:MAG: tetratricopeptide repeat protein [Algoriphagus sp.]|nr:tetratricopeptide repeat protein [Algoriphagus sp.]
MSISNHFIHFLKYKPAGHVSATHKIRRINSSFFIFLFLVLLPFFGQAQSQSFYDSLDLVKSFLNQNQIRDALNLLENLESDNPGNEYVIRLRGQALYWSKDFEATKTYFRKSISENPEIQLVQLDFGRILFELNELNEAEKVLRSFLKSNPNDPEANQMLASINYWTGGRPSVSIEYLDRILTPFPENETAKSLKKEIKSSTSPRIALNTGIHSDTQPMQYFSFQGSLDFYHSAMIQPGFSTEMRSYESGESVLISQARNKSTLNRTGTSISLRAGIVKSSEWAETNPTYGAEISQNISSGIQAAVSVDREPYFYTLTSIDQEILPTTIRTSIGRESGDKWIGKVFFQQSNFEDDNSTFSAGLWALIPVLKTENLKADLGYSLLIADSKELRFAEDLPIQNTIGNTDAGTVIPGSYNPYFTPTNQTVHGILAGLKFRLAQSVSFGLNGNAGIYAQIDNPNTVYYGTATPGNPNRPIDPKDIYLIQVTTTYFPWELKAALDWSISEKSLLTISYLHQTTIYFDSNSFNIGLKLNLWNE